MKTMINLALVMLLALSACEADTETLAPPTTQRATLDEPGSHAGTKEKAEVTYELHLHHTALSYERDALYTEKKMLQKKIENGDENAIAQLEKVQHSIKVNEEYLNITEKMIGRLPIPPAPKPRPCTTPKITNCPVPDVNSTIVLFEAQQAEAFSLNITTLPGEVVLKDNDPESCMEDARCYSLNSLETGSYLLTVRKYFEPAQEMISYTLRFDK